MQVVDPMSLGINTLYPQGWFKASNGAAFWLSPRHGQERHGDG